MWKGHSMRESAEPVMNRIYLFVPPEEYAEVKASGALWDDASKRWYTEGDPVAATLSRWLGKEVSSSDEAEFGVVSEEAFVVAAEAPCVACGKRIEVICIYCESGTDADAGEMMWQFTLSNIWAMDGALAAQLGRWPLYRSGAGEERCFANHCPHCGEVQEDDLLHSEPGDVFFCVPEAQRGLITLTPLKGRIRVSGNISFGV